MAWIIVLSNPLEPLNVKKYEGVQGTIRNWVRLQNPVTGEWPTPTICLLNGLPLMREEWDHELQDRDVVNFIAIQGAFFLIIAIVLTLVMVAVTLLMPVAEGQATSASSDPVFSIKGQGNTIRLGEPIECSYGKNRIFPSYAARPYFRYVGNDQFQHSLLCIGQGVYEVHEVQIGSTNIDNYQEAQYEIVPPGSEVALFATNVYTSAEAGGQMLFAINQPEYTGDGWVGPFVSNPSGTVTKKIEIDLVFPKGIYSMTQMGEVSWMTWAVRFERRLIDDNGNPLGAYAGFTAAPYFSGIGATTTPQRRSYAFTVPEGRYEVRARNVGFFIDSSRVGMDVTWDGLRSWINFEHDYGDVTLLAVKIRATNNLNDRTAQQISVICTRKLPIRESSGEWSAPVATRSIIWAFVDVFRSRYGGRIFDEIFFDWEALEELDLLYSSRGDYFDWIFRDPITVWDAARTIARVGRAVPLISGSLITMRRDGPLSVPVTLFNHENILEGTFDWAIKLWDLDEHDCIRVEYTEVSTGYKQEVVMCILPGGTSDHPMDLRLIGVQDRSHAYREGLYVLATERYLRENVSFETGLEGYIPTFGDLIAVSHDIPKWGQSGYVVQSERDPGGLFYQLWLSEPLTWTGEAEHQIVLRGKGSEIIGPLRALRTSDPMQILATTTEVIDFLETGKTEPMLFVFGTIGQDSKLMKVVRIEPQGNERIRITASIYEPIVHSFDSLIPSALGVTPYAPAVPDLPVVGPLTISVVSGALVVVQVSWSSTYGAQSYLVQTSTDGENWEESAVLNQTSFQMQVRLGAFYVRVAGVGTGQGPWSEADTVVGLVNGLSLSTAFNGNSQWAVNWFDVLGKTGWRVKVYDNTTESVPVLKRTTDLTLEAERLFTYTLADATTDGNVVREMKVEVDVLFQEEGGTGNEPSLLPATLHFFNALPAAPTNMVSQMDSDGPGVSDIVYQLSWTPPAGDDYIAVKLWKSEVDGFDPQADIPAWSNGSGTPVSSSVFSSNAEISVSTDSNGEHPVIYWRVAYFDCWGNEYSTNVSAQQVIPAFVP